VGKLFIIVIILLTFSCSHRVDFQPPIKNQVISAEMAYSEIAAELRGEKSFQELSGEAQELYIAKKSQLEMVRQILQSKKLNGDQTVELIKSIFEGEKEVNYKHMKTTTYSKYSSPNEKRSFIKNNIRFEPMSHPLNKTIGICYRSKWTWDGYRWVPRVSVYNGTPLPDRNMKHPTIEYLIAINPPSSPGKDQWDEHMPLNFQCDIESAWNSLRAVVPIY
jgi:predicted nucleic-acid-binding protein